MIDPSQSTLYAAALEELRGYTAAARAASGEGYRGRFVQLFLGLKYWQQGVPSARSGQYVLSSTLEGMLDDLYAKATRPAADAVAIIFEGSHLPRTGLTVPGKRYPQNTWRNNFQLQKGIGCYADANELDSLTFLNQSRVDCPHLVPTAVGSLRGATCELAVAAPRYRGEDHRKWLKIHPGGEGFASPDLLLSANFAPWVAPAGVRIPVVPLVVALYHDADPTLSLGSRAGGLDLADFALDFNLSPPEFDAYFEQDPANPHNAALLGGPWGITYTRFTAASMVPAAAPGAPPPARTRTPRGRTGARPIPSPVLTPTIVPPPVATAWWDAEQLVRQHLMDAGWTVHHVSRQQLGYDLVAQRGTRTVFVEVKSSSGYCTPSLTAREWQQAKAYRDQYILAVVEHFDPAGANNVYWIPDPATSCVANARTSVIYAIPRASWTRATVATI